MMKNISPLLLFAFGLFTATQSQAQMQQGYTTNDKPSITVDRSVLEDLKGYQPPPMFGSSAPSPKNDPSVIVTPPSPEPVAPPTAPTLTAPNAEDLLHHPVENFHVLTERNASAPLTSPAASPNDGPLLPLPDELLTKQTAPSKKEAPVKNIKKTSPQKADIKSDIKKVEPKKQDDKKTTETIVPLPKKETPPTVTPKINPVKAYRPKASQTMPAVPPISVERNELAPMKSSSLPILPPTTDNETVTEKPSVGLKMMDAALERQMESDENKIKEQLVETDIKTAQSSPKKSAKSPQQKIPKSTIVFKGGEIALSDEAKATIKTQILPEILADKTSRIQILSFATSPDQSESSARRVSLTRALGVRDYLKSLKFDVSRIDVRALAADENTVPSDKIDVVLLK